MKINVPYLSALIVGFIISAAACQPGTISSDEETPPGEVIGVTPPATPEETALCEGDGEGGGVCEVSADCNSPLVCLNGVCIGPNDTTHTCDFIEGIDCESLDHTCINGLCVTTPGACELGEEDDCPNGYICDKADNQCKPVRDGEICKTPGAGPELSGEYKTDSILRLREAIPEPIEQFLYDATLADNIINGKMDFKLGSAGNFIVNAVASSIIKIYVPEYARTLITTIRNVSDILNEAKVEGTLTLKGEPCTGTYRGTHTWDKITLNIGGTPTSIAPEVLSGITDLTPEDFDARFHCGDLLISKHRVRGVMDKLVRWMLDTATEVASQGKYKTIEEGIINIVDCQAIGRAIGQATSAGFEGPVSVACNAIMLGLKTTLTAAIDKAALKLSVLKLQGIVPVLETGKFDPAGIWYGSLAGGSFSGTLEIKNKK